MKKLRFCAGLFFVNVGERVATPTPNPLQELASPEGINLGSSEELIGDLEIWSAKIRNYIGVRVCDIQEFTKLELSYIAFVVSSPPTDRKCRGLASFYEI